MSWIQKEYEKCRQFCKTYIEYEKVKYLTRYDKSLKTKETQLKLEMLNILEGIIGDD